MKSILLIGLGRFGRHIAIKLNELGHEVMAVDHDEERVNAILPYVTNALIGDSTNEEFLRSIGVDNFDVCIVAIGDNFQSSLETTSLLKELGGKLVVSRATRDVHEKFLLRNGADKVVYPEKQLGVWTAITYSSEKVFDYIDLGENHVIMEVSVPDNWVGKTIFDIDVRKKYQINILAIRDSGKLVMNITGTTVFERDQTLLVLGTNEKIIDCFTSISSSFAGSLRNSSISPGWQSSTSHMASRVENLIALTLPVFNFDRFTFATPTFSLNSFSEIFLSAITLSSLKIIAISSPPYSVSSDSVCNITP